MDIPYPISNAIQTAMSINHWGLGVRSHICKSWQIKHGHLHLVSEIHHFVSTNSFKDHTTGRSWLIKDIRNQWLLLYNVLVVKLNDTSKGVHNFNTANLSPLFVYIFIKPDYTITSSPTSNEDCSRQVTINKPQKLWPPFHAFRHGTDTISSVSVWLILAENGLDIRQRTKEKASEQNL